MEDNEISVERINMLGQFEIEKEMVMRPLYTTRCVLLTITFFEVTKEIDVGWVVGDVDIDFSEAFAKASLFFKLQNNI